MTSAPTKTQLYPGHNAAAPTRLPGLDGLRAIAVLLVIGYHYFPALVPGGFIGVDIFFVISGFLITRIILRDKKSFSFRPLRFWRNRARRIIPGLFGLILLCCLWGTLIGPDVAHDLHTQLWGAFTFTSNWTTLTGAGYFAHTSPDLFRNLWSLAVEEQFYLIWPLVMAILAPARFRIRIAVLLLLAVESAVAMAALFTPGSDPTRVYVGTDTHTFGLLLGATAAMWEEHHVTLFSRRTRRQKITIAAGSSALLVLPAAASSTLTDTSAFTYRGGCFSSALPRRFLSSTSRAPPPRWAGRWTTPYYATSADAPTDCIYGTGHYLSCSLRHFPPRHIPAEQRPPSLWPSWQPSSVPNSPSPSLKRPSRKWVFVVPLRGSATS